MQLLHIFVVKRGVSLRLCEVGIIKWKEQKNQTFCAMKNTLAHGHAGPFPNMWCTNGLCGKLLLVPSLGYLVATAENTWVYNRCLRSFHCRDSLYLRDDLQTTHPTFEDSSALPSTFHGLRYNQTPTTLLWYHILFHAIYPSKLCLQTFLSWLKPIFLLPSTPLP